MNRRFPRAKWTLPSVVDPPERLCLKIEVPNERYHIAAFRGALLILASALSWQDDPDHTAKEVAKVWDEIYQSVVLCEPEQGKTPEFILEDDMSDNIRVDPDNSCIIQIKCCGEWTTLIDISKCVPAGITQPTDGTPLEPGGCRAWDVSLRGNDKWLLPLSVNTGDVIEITAATGAWSDGTPQWNCIDGKIMILGGCTTDDPADMGDPLPSVNHMRLIMNVDGTWYDAYNRTLNVPTGVSDGVVYFQANDGSLSDNAGTTSFHIKVCNNSAPTWTQTFNFSGSTYGWDQLYGEYVPGTGFKSTVYHTSPDPHNSLVIQIAFATRYVTSITMHYITGAAASGGGRVIQYNGSENHALNTGAGTFDYSQSPNEDVSSIIIDVSSNVNSSSQNTITQIVISGQGTNPFA